MSIDLSNFYNSGFSIVVSNNGLSFTNSLKSEYDNIFWENSRYIFLFEGVLLNKNILLSQYSKTNYEDLLNSIIHKKEEETIKDFEGEFRGFLFKKNSKELFVFTNVTSTQRVFYTLQQQSLYIDTSLIRLKQRLNKESINVKPNLDAMYQILVFSNMLEQTTPIREVKKLLDGHYLKVDTKELSYTQIQYQNIYTTPNHSLEKNKSIDVIHDLFAKAIDLEYSKDLESQKGHLSLLSGGLDSRVAMMYAQRLNYKPTLAFCFSQSNYLDHKISKKIASDQDIPYQFVDLDEGSFLKNIDRMTALSEGMVFYTGSIHVDYALQHLDFNNFSLFHSGQIGDGILGGFNSAPELRKPSDRKIVANPLFYQKVKYQLEETLKNYESEEHFLMRNVAFNRTVFGAHVLQQKAIQTSPFMEKDFMMACMALPEAWKYNQKFYLEWINKHLPEASRYIWERTMLKPNAYWKINFGEKVVKRFYRHFNNKILRQPQKTSMYPYHYYYDQDRDLRSYYEQYFIENIYLLDDYLELKNDVEKLYSQTDFYSKTQAINILAIFKLYFKN